MHSVFLLIFIFPPAPTFWILKYSISLFSPAVVLIFSPSPYLSPSGKLTDPVFFRPEPLLPIPDVSSESIDLTGSQMSH